VKATGASGFVVEEALRQCSIGVVDRMPPRRPRDRSEHTAGQGLLRCRVMPTDRSTDLTARAGLLVIAELLVALDLEELVGRELRLRRRQRGVGEFDKLQAVLLMLAAGGERVEDIRVLREDRALARMLERAVPAPDGVHDFLRAFHSEQSSGEPRRRRAHIPMENAALQALGRVNTELVRRAAHYKGGRGYQPTAVLWVEEDLVVADEFRDGNVPAGMGVLAVAQRAFEALPDTVQRRYFRADSACYDTRLLRWLWHRDVGFTVSADIGRQLHAVCSSPTVRWRVFEDRVDEVVALAEVEFAPGNWPKRAPPMRYVALRFSGKQGRLFADGKDTKYLAVASNRRDLPTEELVRWHWQKAGTIEQLHDVTKNDLAVRLLPSGRFGANAAWYRLNLMTYNVLTALKRWALPERLRDARPRRLRYEVFALPAVLAEHARQLTVQVGAPSLSVAELVLARGRLRDLHQRLTDERAHAGA
jgi:hypothetical protein